MTGRGNIGCRALLGGLLLGLALLFAFWLGNVSRPGRRTWGCAAGCATPTVRQPGPLRLLSLNMLHGFPRFAHLEQRLDLIAAEVRRQDADIVLLQEVPWTPPLGSAARLLADRIGYNFLYLRANGNRWAILFEEGEAILSRYPLRDADWVELEPQAGWFEHRVALRATAATPWGDLPLVVTHLTNGAPEVNRQQAAALVAFVGDGPAIVAGDFNAEEGSPQMQALAARWVDAYRAAHPDDPGWTCCVDDLTAGPEEPLEKRIDYVFVVPGSGAKVVSARRVLDQPARLAGGWLWASDHVGLLVEISSNPPGQRGWQPRQQCPPSRRGGCAAPASPVAGRNVGPGPLRQGQSRLPAR